MLGRTWVGMGARVVCGCGGVSESVGVCDRVWVRVSTGVGVGVGVLLLF